MSGIEGGENILFNDIGKDEVDKIRLDALSMSTTETIPAATPPPTPTPTFPTATSRSAIAVEPFAVVNSVASRSPAFVAGLLEGDVILKVSSSYVTVSLQNTLQTSSNSLHSSQFGRVTYQQGLTAIPEVVGEAARSRGEIVIDLLRGGLQSRLTLRPREWGGRGVLGCHVVPYKQ